MSLLIKNPLPGAPGAFTTTHWSVVLLAGGGESSAASDALEHLCGTYWYPLYAHVRRQGHGPEDAQDLTQEFFARMIEKKYLQLADPQRGRFRSFLLTALKHFLINEWQKGQTTRRGGSFHFHSMDQQDPEGRYAAEPAEGLAPDKLYDKRWAVALLDRVLARLRDEFAGAGKTALFESLKGRVLGETAAESYAAMATRLGMSEGGLRVAAHRLRERYLELLRAEVSQTVAKPDDVDDELRHLIAALRE